MVFPSGIVVPREVVRGDFFSLGYYARADHNFRSMCIPRVRRVEHQIRNHLVGIRSPQKPVFRERVGIRRFFGKRRRVHAFGVEISTASVVQKRKQSTLDAVCGMLVSLCSSPRKKTKLLRESYEMQVHKSNNNKYHSHRILFMMFLPFSELSTHLCQPK